MSVLTTVSDFASLAGLLKALADETRLRIVSMLGHGELCVCHLEAALRLGQPTVSRHLAVLRHAGVVTARRSGSWMHYSLRAQRDPGCAALLDSLVEGLSTSISRRDLARLVRAKGPNACR